MEKLTFTSSARVRHRLTTLVSDIFKIAVMLAFVFPFYWMIITAFKPYVESMDVPRPCGRTPGRLKALPARSTRALIFRASCSIPSSSPRP